MRFQVLGRSCLGIYIYILVDITPMIANIHVKNEFSTTYAYNCIAFKDNDKTNLDVDNMVLI